MPIIPSVFQPIKQNDVQRRPIKTYKRYRVSNVGFTTESGYFRHDAIYRDHVPHIFADTGQGVGGRIFPINSEDQTNKHIVWNTIDHRYYRSYVPDKVFDYTSIQDQKRFLWYSASIFTAPYGQVGEKIKHGTFEITSSIGDTIINLTDDGNGNLIDPLIDSTTFASSSRNFFYMSFNDAYRRFNDYDELGSISNKIRYELNHISKFATTRDNITITNGIGTTGFRPIIGEEIVRNGDFATAGTINSTSYNLGFHSPDSPSSNITIGSNLLNLNNPSGGGFDGRAYFANTAGTGTLFLPVGKFYRLTYTIAANSSGASLFLYDGDNYNAIDNSVGTHTVDFTPHSDGSPIVLRNGTDGTNIQFSSISLKEILVPKYGLAASISDGENIRIPHDTKFDRFGKCDDWSISFWYMTPNTASLVDKEIITKYALAEESYLDSIDGKRKLRDIEFDRVTDFNNVRTPFSILAERSSSSNNSDSPFTSIKFVASDGTNAFTISSSQFTTEPNEWNHVLIRNSASLAQIFIDGVEDGTSGSLPDNPTLNTADVLIGSPNNTHTRSTINNQFSIAEVRMYDYAVESNAITSLASNDYYSGSLSQTNVAGNVFYKNGQAVVSSPWPKYSSGSGVFGNTFNLTYRGTHTLYENEVLVRVPKDTFNVTMNPTATFRPLTVGDPCLTTPVNGGHATERDVAPGELRKSLFVSGTLKPYITSIGLYDDKSRMLATAKLSTPVQKLDDVDMNFIVRWDY